MLSKVRNISNYLKYSSLSLFLSACSQPVEDYQHTSQGYYPPKYSNERESDPLKTKSEKSGSYCDKLREVWEKGCRGNRFFRHGSFLIECVEEDGTLYMTEEECRKFLAGTFGM